ncbi:3-methyl-2-oxobutanoate hydroxymethyltransferase [Candidatus Margulisiibacteriota bacterium]
MPQKKVRLEDLFSLKKSGTTISALTAYDYFTGRVCEAAEVDIVLVGDSVMHVVYGEEDTFGATVAIMERHTRAVRKSVEKSFLAVDMPFLSYPDLESAVSNAKQLLSAGAEAVKMEGGGGMIPIIEKLVSSGVVVFGHLGFTPQHVHRLSGYKMQGKTKPDKAFLLAEAQRLEKAGISLLVLEMMPNDISKKISETLSIPVIGCGAGKDCDGQILVFHDLFGMSPYKPSFAKEYEDVEKQFVAVVEKYIGEVRKGQFPST